TRRTLDKARAVVEAAENDPERFGKLKDQMDRTGRVDGPYKRVTVMRQADALRAAPPAPPIRGPYGVMAIDFPWPDESGMAQEERPGAARQDRALHRRDPRQAGHRSHQPDDRLVGLEPAAGKLAQARRVLRDGRGAVPGDALRRALLHPGTERQVGLPRRPG